MAAASGKLGQKLIAIADTWVVDPFRPNLQLQTFLKSLATHPKLTPQAVNATRALRDNAMQKRYPLSKKMLQPTSMPLHYDRLVEGFEKSAQGIGRPWWKVFFGIW
ncbi:uncharacterized protein LACBIDRAFT_319031 [Laccaria bicolor S238N-H82]|uniref:Predicted protein n=1 Tax=Laccaria bicolor (strain S238N-H82 / ATCC MYA-4686) TaxID=486041 RepID=B0D7P6_LACBS|nr:uncharacterized protein LACBIDRAFT_319031 [Laccaria bicolor S238N-H82]EDR09687.1 predicted protein [Laccaria bicolor S238N-H82]|eukprot:XP_001880036.1 predicted protein [Laccaria bicolor S238N-H82]